MMHSVTDYLFLKNKSMYYFESMILRVLKVCTCTIFLDTFDEGKIWTMILKPFLEILFSWISVLAGGLHPIVYQNWHIPYNEAVIVNNHLVFRPLNVFLPMISPPKPTHMCYISLV